MIAIIAKENIGYYRISLKKGSIKMQIQLLLTIQPQHLVHILNGVKTLELRKSVPKDFVGWVYLYCVKAKPKWLFSISEKVVARFWFDEYDYYYFNEYIGDYRLSNKNTYPIYVNATIPLDDLCLSSQEVSVYSKGKDLYAWHIKRLEIFDKPKELSDFYYFRTATVYCGMDCPPYVDEVKHTLRKAPKNFRYVYVKGEE
ncbi:MAG: hypothetical protein M0P09_08125 [Acholeplasmataceae bacterium]|nr:hypothetical protein [Acholeplasmataceae bacterium]